MIRVKVKGFIDNHYCFCRGRTCPYQILKGYGIGFYTHGRQTLRPGTKIFIFALTMSTS